MPRAGNKQHSVAGVTAAGASSSPQLFSPEREGRIGNKKIALVVMAITAIAGDVRIDAQEVPRRIRRKAQFEGDRNRNMTPEPVDFSGQARGNSTNVRS